MAQPAEGRTRAGEPLKGSGTDKFALNIPCKTEQDFPGHKGPYGHGKNLAAQAA